MCPGNGHGVAAEIAEATVLLDSVEQELGAIPSFIENEVMAIQRRLARNTAVQARNMAKANHLIGNKERSEAWTKEMEASQKLMVEIDRMCPGAKARMQEMDANDEAVRKASITVM